MSNYVCVIFTHFFIGFIQMMSRYESAVDNDVAVSGLWIQDWAGVLVTSFGHRLYWDWKWNSTYYPGKIAGG